MSKVAVTLNEQQQAEVQVIVADGDAQEALRFLKEVIWGQMRASGRKAMRGPMQENSR